jgi:hypothetical protein
MTQPGVNITYKDSAYSGSASNRSLTSFESVSNGLQNIIIAFTFRCLGSALPASNYVKYGGSGGTNFDVIKTLSWEEPETPQYFEVIAWKYVVPTPGSATIYYSAGGASVIGLKAFNLNNAEYVDYHYETSGSSGKTTSLTSSAFTKRQGIVVGQALGCGHGSAEAPVAYQGSTIYAGTSIGGYGGAAGYYEYANQTQSVQSGVQTSSISMIWMHIQVACDMVKRQIASGGMPVF